MIKPDVNTELRLINSNFGNMHFTKLQRWREEIIVNLVHQCNYQVCGRYFQFRDTIFYHYVF